MTISTNEMRARKAVYIHFHDEVWKENNMSLNLLFENEDHKRYMDSKVEWARIALFIQDSRPITIGNRIVRHEANILIGIFVPENVGTKRIDELRDICKKLDNQIILHRVTQKDMNGVPLQDNNGNPIVEVAGKVKCGVGRTGQYGSESGWHHTVVTVPCHFMEYK